MASTDIAVKTAHGTVYVSRQLLYGQGRKFHRTVVLRTAHQLAHAAAILRKKLNVPPTMKVRIASFKGKSRQGSYYDTRQLAEIRMKHRISLMITTLAHEMVHAEQFHTGKLAYSGSKSYWMQQLVERRGTTYASYRALPWEVEAFDRQESLAAEVFKEMARRGDAVWY